ncbi:SirB2 family protein [Terricaulis sp.]|uniref:SirB2 family protein n=1 Tax=Terricaulis sp. TaxID=2768686 RepID=UPI003783E224
MTRTKAAMEAFYLDIRHVHIAAVSLSGLLFFVRAAAANIFNASWTMAAPVRYLSYTIDSVLLTAALMLMTIVHQFPFVDAWLTAKVLLLVAYIVLGSYALKRAETRRIRLLFSAAAITVFALILGVARAHNPLGWFAL